MEVLRREGHRLQGCRKVEGRATSLFDPRVDGLLGELHSLGGAGGQALRPRQASGHTGLGDPHVKVRIVAGDGGTIAWPLAIGPMLAKRYLLTGDPVDAHEALRLGLVVETAPDGASCREAGMAWAQRLAAGAPQAVQYTKQAINAWIKETAGSAFDLSTALEITTFVTEDHAEALAALAEKREPRFTGR